MKNQFIRCFILVSFALLLSGCLSVSNSPDPRFYMLRTTDGEQVSQKFDIAPGTIIAVGPIGIPEYLDRPQIVTADKNGMLRFAQFDRWASPLDSALGRLITDNLTAMLPTSDIYIFPCNFAIPVDYQVIVDVTRLDSRLDKDMFLVAQWSIISNGDRKMLRTKRSEFRLPVEPHNYHGLVNALSAASGSLSTEIALSLAQLSKEPRPKKEGSQ